jgi:uncharacterized protein YkwD
MFIKSKMVLVLLAIALVALIVPVWMLAQNRPIDQTGLTTMTLSASESSQQRLVDSLTSMAASSAQQTISTDTNMSTAITSTEIPTGPVVSSAITTGTTMIPSTTAITTASQATIQTTTHAETTKATTAATTKTSTPTTTKATTAATTKATTPTTTQSSSNANYWRSELFRLTNLERTQAGLPALNAATPALAKAAGIRAAEIVTKFAHSRPNATSSVWYTVLSECGVAYHTAGENLAWCTADSQTPAGIIGLWMNSTGHRDNIMYPLYDPTPGDPFTMLAIGYVRANGNDYFVQIFIG